MSQLEQTTTENTTPILGSHLLRTIVNHPYELSLPGLSLFIAFVITCDVNYDRGVRAMYDKAIYALTTVSEPREAFHTLSEQQQSLLNPPLRQQENYMSISQGGSLPNSNPPSH